MGNGNTQQDHESRAFPSPFYLNSVQLIWFWDAEEQRWDTDNPKAEEIKKLFLVLNSQCTPKQTKTEGKSTQTNP